jgi:hypothetical protein
MKTYLKLLSLKFLSCLVHRLVEFRLKFLQYGFCSSSPL